jgi:hypothetical protein
MRVEPRKLPSPNIIVIIADDTLPSFTLAKTNRKKQQ